MSETPPHPRAAKSRLLLIRILIVVGLLVAIGMGVGIAYQRPAPEVTGAAVSR